MLYYTEVEKKQLLKLQNLSNNILNRLKGLSKHKVFNNLLNIPFKLTFVCI